VDYQKIRVSTQDGVATVTLADPATLNAASLEIARELIHAFSSIAAGKVEARAVILTGEGRGFCSGANLSGGGAAGRELDVDGKPDAGSALETIYNPLMTLLRDFPLPIVTAVNGPAAGVGCSIGLCGDFVIAGKSGYFLQAFVNIGLVPDGGASWMLPRLVGKARATEMMLLGEKIPGEKAADWGMIYKCVEDDQLQAEARALATRLANGPTIAYGVARKNILNALEQDYAHALNAEAEGQRIAGSSADAMEGGLAFLEKRKAEFKGK